MKRDLARALRQRDIEEICWLLLKEELKCVDKGSDPKLGKATFMKLIDKVASFEQIRAKEAAGQGAHDGASNTIRKAMPNPKELAELQKWADA